MMLRWRTLGFGLFFITGAIVLTGVVALIPPQSQFSSYIEFHKKYPIIALPGATPALLIQNTKELQKSASVSVLPFSDDPEHVWNTDVHPTTFLIQAAKTEEARRNMLRLRTRETAHQYHAELEKLFSAYDAALARAIAGVSVGKPTKIASFKGTTDSTYVAQVLTEGRAALLGMRKEESRRFSCANGDLKSCIQFPSQRRHAALTQIKRQEPADGLPKEVLPLRSSLRAYQAQFSGSSTNPITAELSTSSCYPSYSPIYYDISIRTSSLSPAPAAQFVLLSDAFFYDLAKIPVAFSQEYLKAGATYSYQPFNVYICQNSGREMGDMLAMMHAQAYLQANPIEPKTVVSSVVLRGLKEAQDEFLSKEILSQYSYAKVIRELDLLIKRGDIYALYLFGSRERVEDLRDLVLEERARSAGLEYVVGYFDDLQVSTYSTGVYDAYRTSVFYMLRTGISPLLLLQNETGPFEERGSLFSSTASTELSPTGYALLSFKRDLAPHQTLNMLLEKHRLGHDQVVAPTYRALVKLRASAQSLHEAR